MIVMIGAAIGFHLFCATTLAGIDTQPPSFLFGIQAVLVVGALIYFGRYRPNRSGAMLAGVMLAQIIGSQQAMEAGYAVHFLGRSHPLVDPVLLSMDRSIGYDATSFVRWYDHHPVFSDVLKGCYDLCAYQFVVMMLALLWACQHRRLAIVVTTMFVSLTVVHVVAYFLPAEGVHAFLHITKDDHPNIDLSVAADTARTLADVRSSNTLLIPPHLLGLVTFPSFHMIAACLFGYAFWTTPLRIPALVANALVALSALLHGGHYLTDLVAGGVVAVIVTFLARSAINRCDRLGSSDTVGRGVLPA